MRQKSRIGRYCMFRTNKRRSMRPRRSSKLWYPLFVQKKVFCKKKKCQRSEWKIMRSVQRMSDAWATKIVGIIYLKSGYVHKETLKFVVPFHGCSYRRRPPPATDAYSGCPRLQLRYSTLRGYAAYITYFEYFRRLMLQRQYSHTWIQTMCDKDSKIQKNVTFLLRLSKV